MPRYGYKGTRKGEKVEGELVADNDRDARRKLKVDKIVAKTLKQKAFPVVRQFGPFGGVNKKEILNFSKKLATMIRSGLPMIDAIKLVFAQTDHPLFKEIIGQIVYDLENGKPIVDTFAQWPQVFDNVYLNMLAAGELSGNLDNFLDKLVQMLEKQEKIKAGIKSALFYPITLVVVSVGITLFMLTNVVPTFVGMYENLGVELPGPTAAIVGASDWLLKEGGLWKSVGGAILFFTVFGQAKKRIPPFKKVVDIAMLKVPLFGEILVKGMVARMGLLMANLIGAGVGIVDVLNIAKTVSANSAIQNGMDEIARGVVTGRELSALFAAEKVFPIAVSQFVAVGERTGNIEEMLSSLAKYYEEEFDAVVEGLSTVIEPIMIVVVGGMIGALVVAMYLPIFSAGDLVG
ncbi:MAG: type II secretion system F family protein [Litorivicinus sp.]